MFEPRATYYHGDSEPDHDRHHNLPVPNLVASANRRWVRVRHNRLGSTKALGSLPIEKLDHCRSDAANKQAERPLPGIGVKSNRRRNGNHRWIRASEHHTGGGACPTERSTEPG